MSMQSNEATDPQHASDLQQSPSPTPSDSSTLSDYPNLSIIEIIVGTSFYNFNLSDDVLNLYASQTGISRYDLANTCDKRRADPILVSIVKKLGPADIVPVKVVDGYYKIINYMHNGEPSGIEGVEFCDTLHIDIPSVMLDRKLSDSEKVAMYKSAYYEMEQAKRMWRKEKCGRRV